MGGKSSYDKQASDRKMPERYALDNNEGNDVTT